MPFEVIILSLYCFVHIQLRGLLHGPLRGDSTVLTSSPPSVDSDANEMSRYLGQNSIPALLREQASPSQQEEGVEYIRQDMRSILGLDNSAPFPLMSSRHLDRLTIDISAELPSDREVMKWVSPRERMGSPAPPYGNEQFVH